MDSYIILLKAFHEVDIAVLMQNDCNIIDSTIRMLGLMIIEITDEMEWNGTWSFIVHSIHNTMPIHYGYATE